MEQYNDKDIIRKIINTKFTLQDVAPKVFPKLQHGLGMYCPFHENSHTGTQHARIYYNDEYNIWYMHCYVCGRNYFAYDYVERILCREREKYRNPKAFLLANIDTKEFVALYKIYEQKKQEVVTSRFKRTCQWIDNVYAETGNTIDYIESLYTA